MPEAMCSYHEPDPPRIESIARDGDDWVIEASKPVNWHGIRDVESWRVSNAVLVAFLKELVVDDGT